MIFILREARTAIREWACWVNNGIRPTMANLAENIVNRKLNAITPQLEANLQQKLVQAKTELQGLLLMCID